MNVVRGSPMRMVAAVGLLFVAVFLGTAAAPHYGVILTAAVVLSIAAVALAWHRALRGRARYAVAAVIAVIAVLNVLQIFERVFRAVARSR
jgi:hypothetical membrane protein